MAKTIRLTVLCRLFARVFYSLRIMCKLHFVILRVIRIEFARSIRRSYQKQERRVIICTFIIINFVLTDFSNHEEHEGTISCNEGLRALRVLRGEIKFIRISNIIKLILARFLHTIVTRPIIRL